MTGSYKHLLEARADGKGHWRVGSGNPAEHKNRQSFRRGLGGRWAHCLRRTVDRATRWPIVDLDAGKVTAQIPTGVCPFDVLLSADGQTAYVSNFGGRRARKGEHAEPSAGTPVVVDDRSLAISGTITPNRPHSAQDHAEN